MKTIMVITLLLIAATSALAQSGWFWQNPQPQGNDLRSVSFSNTNIGTAVGYDGTILRTTNGGTSWAAQSSGTKADFYSVSFTDANNGISVGTNGTILRTTNGGAIWTAQSSGTANILYGVCFTDANNAVAVGQQGTIRRTTNGGAN